MTFPFRLIVAAYALSALAATAAYGLGMAVWGVLFTFWLGGSALVFVMPALGHAAAAFRHRKTADAWRSELESEHRKARQAAHLAVWDADLAIELQQRDAHGDRDTDQTGDPPSSDPQDDAEIQNWESDERLRANDRRLGPRHGR